MLVLLSVSFLPELVLANNTRGIIRDVLYPPGGFDPEDASRCPIVVVDFPGFTGTPWDPANPTWILIASVDNRCDRGCCSRRGLPLWPGKAASTHSLQGLTVGDGKFFERIVLHWGTKAEGKWPGIYYVGASRAMAGHNLALSKPLSKTDLEAITQGRAWRSQNSTVAGLERKAQDLRHELSHRNDRAWHQAHRWGSKYDFAQRVFQFIGTHGPSVASVDTIPQRTKAEVIAALKQWQTSLLDLGYQPST
jgi:hypothetical protein